MKAMHGIWVALSRPVSVEQLRTVLTRSFPRATHCTRDEALRLDTPWPAIVFALEDTKAADFPAMIGFDAFPGTANVAVAVSMALGRKLAREFRCRSLCECPESATDGTPYASLLWDDDRPFLADDSNSALFDGEGGAVRVVRGVDAPSVELDEAAALVVA
jgi:hypothetical protein